MSGTTIGQASVADATSEYNSFHFVIRQLIARVNTATLVQIQKVTNAGDVSPIGYVDVLPLVNQIDGDGQPTPHITIYNLPYCRLQGGSNAVILDPKVGDVGVAVFASRDISTAKATKKQSNPGSRRRHSMADGMYIMTVIADAPTNYIQFKSDGSINIVSTAAITFNGTNATLDASGNLTVTGDVVAAGGISLIHHVHTGVQGGTSITGPATG